MHPAVSNGRSLLASAGLGTTAEGSVSGRVHGAVELLLVQVIAVIRRSALVEWTSFAS